MADNGAPTYPVIFVTDNGAPAGSVYVHDQATGMTVTAPNTTDGYLQAVKDLNNHR
jgi:hypothetical protein